MNIFFLSTLIFVKKKWLAQFHFYFFFFFQEHDDVPEVLVDLQYSLAKSYSSTPELRETWLEHMAAVHESHENYSEVSQLCAHNSELLSVCLLCFAFSSCLC